MIVVVERRTTVERSEVTWVAVTVSAASVTSSVTVMLDASHSEVLEGGAWEAETAGAWVMVGFADEVGTMLV